MGDTRDLTKTRSPGIYRTQDGRFVLRWTVQVQGHRKDREETLSQGASFETAISERAKRVADAKSPMVREETPQVERLGDFALSWLKRKTMKPRARETYAQILEDHVLPILGEIRVDQLRRSDLERWTAYVEEWAYRPVRARKPKRYEPQQMVLVSRDTLLGWWTKLKQLVRDACAEYGLRDVTERLKGPGGHGRPKIQEVRTLTKLEVLRVISELPIAWRVEAFCDARTGMRPGELYELRWDLDVDFAREVITISRSHARGLVGTTKNNKIKEIPMGPELSALLREHRRRQLLAQGEALATGLVFPSSEQGKTNWRRRPSALRNALVRAGRDAGVELRVTPQVLRRTFNTLLKQGGTDSSIVQAMMGHSSEAMTERYFHASSAAKRSAVLTFESEPSPNDLIDKVWK